MSVFMLAAAATSAATAVLMIQVAHRRHTGTASTDDTSEMALFANAWSWAAAMTSIAGRLLLGHLLPTPWAASFDSAAAGAATALMGAIACASFTWTALIVFQTWLRAYHAAEARNAGHEERVRAASEAVLPKPLAANTVNNARRGRDARLHAIRILLMGTLLGAITGTATTLAVNTNETPIQQTLAALARHAAVISGTLSAALWLHLGMQSKTHNGNGGARPDGTPQGPAPTAR